MSDDAGIRDNMAKGRGIVEKSPFKVVGCGQKDLETGGHDMDEKRNRGRPAVDKTWSQVGKSYDQETGKRG